MIRVPSERRLVLLVATVCVVAVFVFAAVRRSDGRCSRQTTVRRPQWLVFWTALTLLVSSFPVVTPRGSVVSVSIAPILASAILGGPTAAAVVGFVGVLELRELRREIPWYGTLYNHCSTVIAAVLAGHCVLDWWAVAVMGHGHPATLLAALIAGAVFFLVAELSCCGVRGPSSAQIDTRAVASSDVRSYGLTFLGLVPLAWLMAFAYVDVGPLVVVLFALPLYTTRAAYQSVVELRRMFTQTVRALASAIDARDPSTKRHSEHVAGIAVEIGQEMRVSEAELEILEWAGLFHDIGKIGIPDAILLKPGRLDKAERMEMNKHPVKGAEILANAERLRYVVPLVKFHHEWYNGSGYPDRLIGEEIPLLARILAVADSFEAMTAVRPYQTRPKTLEQAIEELRRCAGTQFDPNVVEAFVRTRTARGLGEIAPAEVAPRTRTTRPGTRPDRRRGRLRCRALPRAPDQASDHAVSRAWLPRHPAPNPSHASNDSVS